MPLLLAVRHYNSLRDAPRPTLRHDPSIGWVVPTVSKSQTTSDDGMDPVPLSREIAALPRRT
jgi:hypothetical protein